MNHGKIKMKLQTIEEAIKSHGSAVELAKIYDTTSQQVSRWKKYGVVFVDGKPFKPVSVIRNM